MKTKYFLIVYALGFICCVLNIAGCNSMRSSKKLSCSDIYCLLDMQPRLQLDSNTCTESTRQKETVRDTLQIHIDTISYRVLNYKVNNIVIEVKDYIMPQSESFFCDEIYVNKQKFNMKKLFNVEALCNPDYSTKIYFFEHKRQLFVLLKANFYTTNWSANQNCLISLSNQDKYKIYTFSENENTANLIGDFNQDSLLDVISREYENREDGLKYQSHELLKLHTILDNGEMTETEYYLRIDQDEKIIWEFSNWF